MSEATAPFQLALPFFSGDMDQLVRLVSERKMPAEQVAISLVTAEYSRHLESRDAIDLTETGEFLAAAARLLALKSARLLAQPVSEDAEQTADDSVLWLDGPALAELSARVAGIATGEAIAPMRSPVEFERRVEPRPAHILPRLWKEMSIRRRPEDAPIPVPSFVRLEAAVSSLIRRLKTQARVSFRRLVGGGSRGDVVVHFLAVLELVRRGQAQVNQDELFADITVEMCDGATDAATRAG